MRNEIRSGFGFDDAVMIARRRKWLGLSVFVVPFAISMTLTAFLPNIYQSTATVLVDRQQVPEMFVRSTVTSALGTRLQAITQEILSRSRLEELISRFGLYADLRRRVSPEIVIERMRGDIQLDIKGVDPTTRERTAVAFTISYRGTEPQTVALVTNTLASFYIEENLKARERQATGTSEFLKVQVAETKKRLEEQERQLSEFKARHLGELPQLMEANLATLERLHTQLRLNGDRQLLAIERRAAFARQTTDGDGAAGGDLTANRLAKLRQDLAELRTQYSDKYPDVARVKAEIAALEADLGLGGDSRTPRRGRLGELDAELKALRADEAKLKAAIADYERRVQNAPQREQEFQELTRDQASTKEMYKSLLNRYEEAQLAESMEQRQKGEQFRILDPATPSDQPAAPKRGRLVAIGLALSLVFGIGAIVLAEKLDTSFHEIDDLRRSVSVPVLMSVARIVADVDMHRRRWQMRLAAVAGALGVVVLVAASAFLAHGNEQLVWMLSRPTNSADVITR
jgi:protein tyrosine kinase modulator